MTARRVVVVGCGVAGVAAAYAARRAGAEVTVLSGGPSASAWMSGALDDRCVWQAEDVEGPEGDLKGFLEAIQIWTGPERCVVATGAGTLRLACGRDRAVLDLSRLRNARVGVPEVARVGWMAGLLARSWQAEAWAVEAGVRFEAFACPGLLDGEELVGIDSDVGRRLDSTERAGRFAEALRAGGAGFDAVLVGPWLGVESQAWEAVTAAVGKPVGEMLSALSGSAGARFEAAAIRLLRSMDAEYVESRALGVEQEPSGFVVEHASGGHVRGDAVVLACGGIAGGGIVLNSAGAEGGDMPSGGHLPFALSCKAPVELCLRGEAVEVTSSLHGMNLESLHWFSEGLAPGELEQVGVRRRGVRVVRAGGELVDGLYVAGAAGCGAGHAVLDSLRSGLEAGAAAAR